MNIHEIQAVVFDCDGVVIDSGADMASAVNSTLAHFGLCRLPESQIVSFVGNGARMLIVRSVAAAEGKTEAELSADIRIDGILDWYKAYYNDHAVERTVLYPGYRELLETLAARGYHMAVVSNKPLETTRRILEHFSIAGHFDAVVGPEMLKRIKPDPEGLALALLCINEKRAAESRPLLQPAQVLMVGDSWVDIRTGRNFGCNTCAVTGGLGDSEKLAAEHADMTVTYAGELAQLL